MWAGQPKFQGYQDLTRNPGAGGNMPMEVLWVATLKAHVLADHSS